MSTFLPKADEPEVSLQRGNAFVPLGVHWRLARNAFEQTGSKEWT